MFFVFFVLLVCVCVRVSVSAFNNSVQSSTVLYTYLIVALDGSISR